MSDSCAPLSPRNWLEIHRKQNQFWAGPLKLRSLRLSLKWWKLNCTTVEAADIHIQHMTSHLILSLILVSQFQLVSRSENWLAEFQCASGFARIAPIDSPLY